MKSFFLFKLLRDEPFGSWFWARDELMKLRFKKGCRGAKPEEVREG